VSDIVDIALDRARERWPAVKLERNVLAAHIARLVTSRGHAPHADHAGDVALACACARGDKEALAIFENEMLARVPSYLVRIRGPSTLVDDVRQELRQKLLVSDSGTPKIADFAGDGSLESWLRVGAVRTALKMVQHTERAEKPIEEAVAATSPELELVRARHREDFERAVRESFRSLSPAERTLLRLRFVDGLELEALAALQRSHRSTVVRKLAAARMHMVDEVRRILREQKNLTASEIRSIIAVLRSELELTLRTTRP
jgi:RNA polymerase sigma-70 factor (ECF subfamily)